MSIPINIEEIYKDLKTEIAWLHGRWIIYDQLFNKSKKRIDLFNESAPGFFYIIQDILVGNIQISLSKLTDPAQTRGYENLSLELLHEKIVQNGEDELINLSRNTLDKLLVACEPFRTWRNKRLAHLDLKTVKKISENPLPSITKKMIVNALELVRIYMNHIEGHYNNSEYEYENTIMGSDGEDLVSMLISGTRYEELLQNRSIPFEDCHKGKWYNT